jgi:hypothetical protein
MPRVPELPVSLIPVFEVEVGQTVQLPWATSPDGTVWPLQTTSRLLV